MVRSGGLLDDPRGLDKARPRTWRRRLIRLVSLGVVVYAANALLGLAEPALSSGQIRGVSSSGDPDCVRGGVQCDANPARPTIDAVALRLPDPDPSSGKSRYYSANHWFHVSEFHARNHARLRSIDALPPLRRGNGVVIALADESSEGGNAITSRNGQMIDAPIVARARAVLALRQRFADQS